MIIHQIVIISLLVFAIHYTMLEGEIFGFVRKWWGKKEEQLLERIVFYEAEAETVKTRYHQGDLLDAILVTNKRRKGIMTNRLRLLEKISQPIFDCPVCMLPYYGTILYWIIPWGHLGLPRHHWVDWLICIIGGLGLNSIIVRIFKSDE
jgi:hypothetical protein